MEKKKCVQCGETFTITDSEKQFFENRNLHLPKRCKKCREKNNPQQLKTNPYQGTQKNKKTAINKKISLIIVIFLIVLSIIYVKDKIGPEDNKVIQDVNTSESYTFRNESLLQEHFNEHGSEFGYVNSSQYESGANAVIHSMDAICKTEAEDGDTVYYIQQTNELVILSTDQYIRTYFKPEDGISYYNRQ